MTLRQAVLTPLSRHRQTHRESRHALSRGFLHGEEFLGIMAQPGEEQARGSDGRPLHPTPHFIVLVSDWILAIRTDRVFWPSSSRLPRCRGQPDQTLKRNSDRITAPIN